MDNKRCNIYETTKDIYEKYNENEVRRIAKIGFEAAMKSKKKFLINKMKYF